jgi:hypothetical protein
MAEPFLEIEMNVRFRAAIFVSGGGDEHYGAGLARCTNEELCIEGL